MLAVEHYLKQIKANSRLNAFIEIYADEALEKARELDKKRNIAINKKQQALLKDEVWKYGGEEDTIDYVLFRIRELTGRLI